MNNLSNTHGIYCLYFENDNNQFYIGKSLDLLERKRIHDRDLRNTCHHNIHLQNAYNKYKVYPTMEILEIPNLSDLASREIYWIKEFDSYHKGYNRTGGGEGAGYGETSPSALYSEETYITILFMLANTEQSMVSISKELEVSLAVVVSIALKNSHMYLQNLYPEEYKKATGKHGDSSTVRAYPDSLYISIMNNLANTTKKLNIIALEHNVDQGIVEDISRGATHKYLSISHPEVYSLMLSKKGSRRMGSQSGNAYPSVIDPLGNIYSDITNAKAFALEHNLHQGHFGELLRGKAKSHVGWKLL